MQKDFVLAAVIEQLKSLNISFIDPPISSVLSASSISASVPAAGDGQREIPASVNQNNNTINNNINTNNNTIYTNNNLNNSTIQTNPTVKRCPAYPFF
jgi:hypothetical protein